MRDAEEPFLNEEHQTYQHQLRQRVGGVHLGQGLVPELGLSLLGLEHEPAVQQVGHQHGDEKIDQVAELFMEMKDIVACIYDQVGK